MARTVRRDHRTGAETRDNPHGCHGRKCVCIDKWHKGLGNAAERNKVSVRRQLID